MQEVPCEVIASVSPRGRNEWSIICNRFLGERFQRYERDILSPDIRPNSIIDFRQYIIPDKVNIVILVLGIVATIVDRSQWKEHVIGFFSVSVILLIIYLVTVGRGIGGGDVKLMAVAGLVIGWKACIVAFIVGCIAGSIIHVIRMKVSGANHRLALGPYLSMGIWFAMLFSEPIIEWYLRLCGLA